MDSLSINKYLQMCLNKLGASPALKVDGIVGPKTESALLKELNEADSVEPERPSPSAPGAKLLWYPLADTSGPQMKTRGTYAKGYPEGAVVHFTAGRDESESDAKGSADYGVSQGYVFFVIGPTGKVYQRFPLNKWGYHAGTSSYPGLGSSVSSKVVGIEVACAGKLDANRKSWFGKTYQSDECRTVSSKENVQGGTYKKFTEAQEKSLIQLLVWLKTNNPDVFKVPYIVGHDEVSPGRKNDPGGSLSMTMPELRRRLQG